MDTSIKNSEIEQEDAYEKLLKSNYNDLNQFFDNLNKLLENDEVYKDDKFEDKISNRLFFFRNMEKAQAEFSDRMKMSINSSFDSIKIICKDSFDKAHHFVLKLSPNKSYRIKEHTLPEMIELNADFKGAINIFI